MIVVAIIGILATLALPEYENYTMRAKISEAIQKASACKAMFQEELEVNPNKFRTMSHVCPHHNESEIVTSMHFFFNSIEMRLNPKVFAVPHALITLVPYGIRADGKFAQVDDPKNLQGAGYPSPNKIHGWVCVVMFDTDFDDMQNIPQKYLPKDCIRADSGEDDGFHVTNTSPFWDIFNKMHGR